MAYSYQNGVPGISSNQVILRVHHDTTENEDIYSYPNLYNTLGIHLCCSDCHPGCTDACPQSHTQQMRGHGADYEIIDHILNFHHGAESYALRGP